LQDGVKSKILQQCEYTIDHEYLALLEQYWPGIKKFFEKDLVQCHWSVTNVKWIGPSWHASHCSGRSATDRMNHGTADCLEIMW